MDLFKDVGDFHRKFDLPAHPCEQEPCLLEADVVEYRTGFMQEELDEFKEACRNGDKAKAVDALADLTYVALGTAHLMAMPFNDVWAEVHRANMTKERAKSSDDPRSTRKHALDVVKPADFRPPDIEGVLKRAGCYDKIAKEYYDARHQTCRNFDATTLKALSDMRLFLPPPIIELGAGRGRCIEFTGRVASVQVDSSFEMLNIHPREPGIPVLADARSLPFPAGSFRSAVAFLCDPFLDDRFLAEVRRVTRDEVLLTFPCADWAIALRGGEDKHETTFVTNDGGKVTVPSNIWRGNDLQMRMIQMGFRQVDVSFHYLPVDEEPSEAVKIAARNVGVDPIDLPLITLIRAYV